jgi:hypothetical protein
MRPFLRVRGTWKATYANACRVLFRLDAQKTCRRSCRITTALRISEFLSNDETNCSSVTRGRANRMNVGTYVNTSTLLRRCRRKCEWKSNTGLKKQERVNGRHSSEIWWFHKMNGHGKTDMRHLSAILWFQKLNGHVNTDILVIHLSAIWWFHKMSGHGKTDNIHLSEIWWFHQLSTGTRHRVVASTNTDVSDGTWADSLRTQLPRRRRIPARSVC